MMRKTYLAACFILVGLQFCVLCYAQNSDSEEDVKKTTCNCGWTNKGRIVGGKSAVKHTYPMVVSLGNMSVPSYKSHFCGGSIITPWHILTAAHCTHVAKPIETFIKVSVYDLYDDKDGVKYPVDKFIEHEKYNDDLHTYDIAIVVTATPIVFNTNVGPVCMPAQKIDVTGQSIKALGWGLTTAGGYASNILLQVNLKAIEYSECAKHWNAGDAGPHQDQNLCTFRKGHDVCNGDSGGPLIWLDPQTNRYTLVALVSKGGTCGTDKPALNTNVSMFLDWIDGKIMETKPGAATCTKIIH